MFTALFARTCLHATTSTNKLKMEKSVVLCVLCAMSTNAERERIERAFEVRTLLFGDSNIALRRVLAEDAARL